MSGAVERMRVKIANKAVEVRCVEDERAMDAALALVEERFQEVAGRYEHFVDTQAFALETAYEIALELKELRRDYDADIRGVTLALERFAGRLEDLTKDRK